MTEQFTLIPCKGHDEERPSIYYQMKVIGTKTFNLPAGQLQYELSPEVIMSLPDRPFSENENPNEIPTEWEFLPISKENVDKIYACVKYKKSPFHKDKYGDYRPLFIMRKLLDNGYECMKAAFQNKTTGKVALLSSLNQVALLGYSGRTLQSHHPDYKICWCKMIAPLVFWTELKNRLRF